MGIELRKEALLDALLSSNLPRLQAILGASPGLLNEPLNEMQQTLMHLVCFRTTNKAEVLRYLLSLRPDVNLVEAAGFTPILYAAKSGLWATCILLLTSDPMGRGLRVNVQTATGWNLLLMLCAAERPTGDALEEYMSLLRLVHSRGIDYSAVSKHGETGLHCAAISNNTQAAEFLLVNSTIHVDAVNDMGESALHNAVRAGHGDVAMLLLEYGASPDLVCSRGGIVDEARSPMQELEQRLKKRHSATMQQLHARMLEVVHAKASGQVLDWLKDQASSGPQARALSPVKAFMASKSVGRSEEQRLRSSGFTLGGQRQVTNGSTANEGDEATRQSRAPTVKAQQVTRQGSDVAALPESSERLSEPIVVAPLMECFEELVGLAANVNKLVRKRAAKLYSVGTMSKKEKTCIATIAMLVRRLSCQRGSFRSFKSMLEDSVRVHWNPVAGATTSNVRWAAIFHHRMLQCGQLLRRDQQQSILDVLEFHQSMTKKKSIAASRLDLDSQHSRSGSDIDQVELEAVLVNDMRLHLLSHSLDPDNSLVGLRPSARLVGNLGVDLASMHAACQAFDSLNNSVVEHKAPGAPLRSRGLTISAAPQGNIRYESFPASAYPAVTQRDLSSVFVEQLQFVEDSELLVKSRALIEILRHDRVHSNLWEECKTLAKGDLVIAFTPPSSQSVTSTFDSFDPLGQLDGLEEAANFSYSIMRYSGAYIEYWSLGGETVPPFTPGAYRGCYLRLYPIPEEVTICDIDVRVVVPLPLSALQRIAKGHVSAMEELVDGPISASMRRVLSEMSSQHSSLLGAKGVDVAILQRCTTFSIGLKDIDVIAAQHRLLTKLLDSFTDEFQEFLGQMRSAIETRHRRLVSTIRLMDREFFPLRETRLQQLLDLPIETLLRNRLESYKLNTESAFVHLRHVREGLVDGTQKRNITSWWLGMISTRQKEFLREIGYNFDAVPNDYIETKPDDIDVVCDNLDLIQSCLLRHGTQDKHNVKERLLYPLMKEIYPRVNEFISNIRFSLSDGLGISAEEFSIQSANVLLQERTGTEQHSFLLGLLKDLEYLETIKVLEAEFMGADWEATCGISSSALAQDSESAEALAKIIERNSSSGSVQSQEQRHSASLKVSHAKVREERRSIEEAMTGGRGKTGSSNLLASIRTSSEAQGTSAAARQRLVRTTSQRPTSSLGTRDQNIVPMSGLIMNVFYRLENELRTVLEVWAIERLDHFSQEVAEPNLSPRSRRLLDDDDNVEGPPQFRPPGPETALNRRRTRRLV